MDRFRYILALLLLIGWPSGVLLWLAIHPFVRFWRRFGAGWTYAILATPTLLLMFLTWRWRGWLLASDFGTSYPLVALGIVAAVASTVINVKRRKYLTFRILAGVPELSGGEDRGTLLRQGIYGRVRHPRYVEAVLGVLAYTLIANYLALYVVLIASLPILYLVVLLEEGELHDRFGGEYAAYCREVPRFVPRRRTEGTGSSTA